MQMVRYGLLNLKKNDNKHEKEGTDPVVHQDIALRKAVCQVDETFIDKGPCMVSW